MTKIPKKFPAKGWRKLRIGTKILPNDVWAFSYGKFEAQKDTYLPDWPVKIDKSNTDCYRRIKRKKNS